MKLGVISLALASALALAVAGGSIAGSTPDVDGDGVLNLVDNCTVVPNAPGSPTDVQHDFDSDGFGGECDADLNNTGTINIDDFNIFIGCFLSPPPLPDPLCSNADMNQTDTLNVDDFNLFIGPFLDPSKLESGLTCARYGANDPNMTGRHPCTYDPAPND